MTVCYFGIYDSRFGRNRVYLKGLRENGVTIIECRDTSPGFLKYWWLLKKHYALKGNYDALVVGYPGHLVVPFARLISHKPIIADLLGSLADAEAYSHRPTLFRRIKSWLVDWFAVFFADVIFLESEAQKRFFEGRFGRSKRYQVLYTGADDSVFWPSRLPIENPFIVLFRGRLTAESGISHILKAAALLRNEKNLQFRIIGSGPLLASVQEQIQKDQLSNVELISEYLSEDVLREKIGQSSLALGQFEDNPRLSRTIPHKAFEAFATGIPYLSGNTPAIREIIQDGETGFLVPLADPQALAQKIRELSKDLVLLARVSASAKAEFNKRFLPRVLAQSLLEKI